MQKPEFTMSLRIKLFVAFAIVALAPLLTLTVINGRTIRNTLTDEANNSLYFVANEVSTKLDDFIISTKSELLVESQLPVILDYYAMTEEARYASSEELRVLALLTALEGKSEYVRSYALLNPEGLNILDSYRPYQGQSEADRDYFRHFQANSIDNKPFVSAIQFRPDVDEGLLIFNRPIINKSGAILGYLRAEYDAIVLQTLLEEQNDLAGPGSFGVLFDDYFIHLGHGTEPAVNFVPIVRFSPEVEADLQANYRLQNLPDDQLYPMQLDELEAGLGAAKNEPFFEATDVATGDLINQVAVAQLSSQPWSVAFFQPQHVFLEPIENQTQQTALLVAVIAGVAVLAAYLFGGLLVRPLSSLSETVTQFTEGNLLARSDITANDEIGLLATHFNELAEQVGMLLTGLESRTEALEQEAKKLQQTDNRLRQQRRFLRQVININPSFIFAKDRDGRFVMVNQAFADTYNTTIDNMIGKTDADFNLDSQKVAQFRRDDLHVFESGQELYIPEQKTINDYGETRWWQTIKRPLFNEEGIISEVLTVVTEITERKQNEEALLVARDRALEAGRVKSEILAKANHELQTPLGAILGYAEMIESGYFGNVTDQQQEILQKIIMRTNQLTKLIQDVLTQANLEAKRNTYNQTSFLPEDLLHKMHQNMDAKAENKKLALTSEIDENFPGILFGVPERLQMILTNLVGNGIKFTEHGFVHVRLFQPDIESWAIEVSDSGPGIPKEAHDYIFEPFRQVDGSITRTYQGFGLGLSLVKELALTMEGDISLSSELGKGSTFVVIFPYVTNMELVS